MTKIDKDTPQLESEKCDLSTAVPMDVLELATKFVLTDTDNIVIMVQNYKVPENEKVKVSHQIAVEKSDDQVSFKCDRCTAVFVNHSFFLIHQNLHIERSVGARIKCDYCAKIFRSIKSFNTHRVLCKEPSISKISEEEIELSFFCCRKLFSNHTQLWLHLRACYPGICRPKFYCSSCKKSYTSEAKGINHYATFHRQSLSNLFLTLRKSYKCCVSFNHYSSDLLKLIKHNAHCLERIRNEQDEPQLKEIPLKTYSKNKSAPPPKLPNRTSDIITLDNFDTETGSRTSPVPTKPRIFVRSLADLKKPHINTDDTAIQRRIL